LLLHARKEDVRLWVQSLLPPYQKALESCDFAVVLFSFAMDGDVASLIRNFVDSIKAFLTGDWVFVGLGTEADSSRIQQVTDLRRVLAARFHGEFVEASVVAGAGIHEVFEGIGKSWVRFK
jgi:hypothetical protein